MKSRDLRDYLHGILDSVAGVEIFIGDMFYGEFVRDRKTINAVVRSIEIIGEASKKIPVALRDRYAELPWREITGMRDKVIHGYFGIDYETIWKAVKEDIPSLKKVVRKMLKEQENQ